MYNFFLPILIICYGISLPETSPAGHRYPYGHGFKFGSPVPSGHRKPAGQSWFGYLQTC